MSRKWSELPSFLSPCFWWRKDSGSSNGDRGPAELGTIRGAAEARGCLVVPYSR